MVQIYRASDRCEQEAERCERLGRAVYDPALSSQLFRLARDYRVQAARARANRAA